MNTAIQLYGFLLLTCLGFFVPILSILFSIYKIGIQKLSEQYDNERNQSESNLNSQLESLKSKEKTSDIIIQIKKNIKALEKSNKIAAKKLSFLNPKKQIILLFISIIISFILVLAYFIIPSSNISIKYIKYGLIVFSAVIFTFAFIRMVNLLLLITEIKNFIDQDQQNNESKIIELLSKLAKVSNKEYLEKVYIRLNNKNITPKSKIKETIMQSEKTEIKLQITNFEKLMAKNVEIGICFPSGFIVTVPFSYSVTTTEYEKIVRCELNKLQGDTTYNCHPIYISALEKGEYKIESFIKAENIKARYTKFKIIAK